MAENTEHCRLAARCARATLLGKVATLQFVLLRVPILNLKINRVTVLAVQPGSGGAFGGDES
jgi:hypothetical protein